MPGGNGGVAVQHCAITDTRDIGTTVNLGTDISLVVKSSGTDIGLQSLEDSRCSLRCSGTRQSLGLTAFSGNGIFDNVAGSMEGGLQLLAYWERGGVHTQEA